MLSLRRRRHRHRRIAYTITVAVVSSVSNIILHTFQKHSYIFHWPNLYFFFVHFIFHAFFSLYKIIFIPSFDTLCTQILATYKLLTVPHPSFSCSHQRTLLLLSPMAGAINCVGRFLPPLTFFHSIFFSITLRLFDGLPARPIPFATPTLYSRYRVCYHRSSFMQLVYHSAHLSGSSTQIYK